MSEIIPRPVDPYDPAWPAYWAQNPIGPRSVGSAESDPAAPPATPPATPPASPPAEPPATPPTATPPAQPPATPPAAPPATPPATPPAATPPTTPPAATPPGAPPATPEPEKPTAWRDGIKDAEAKKFAENSPDLDHFVKRALDMRQKLSKAIVLPGEKATEEEVKDFRTKLGIPTEGKDYEFVTPEGQEPTELDKQFQDFMRPVLLDANVTKDGAKKLAEKHREFMAGIAAEEKRKDDEYAKQSDEQLRKDWPGAEHDRNKAFGRRAAETFFGDYYAEAEQIVMKDGRMLLDHPVMARMLAAVGREMGEDRIGSAMSDTERQTAQEKINELQTQRMDAHAKGDSITFKRLTQEQDQLYGRISGGQPAVGAQGRTL